MVSYMIFNTNTIGARTKSWKSTFFIVVRVIPHVDFSFKKDKLFPVTGLSKLSIYHFSLCGWHKLAIARESLTMRS